MGLFDGLYKPNVEKLEQNKDVKGLIKALGYQNDCKIRADAIIALGKIGDPRAVDALIACLNDACVEARDNRLIAHGAEIRYQAIKALSAIGTPAVDQLIAALKNSDADVRWNAIIALCKIEDSSAVGPLIAALKKSGLPLIADCKISGWRLRDNIIDLLENKQWTPDYSGVVAYFLVFNMDFDKCITIGAPAVEPLITALQDPNMCEKAADALGKIGDARAVEPLIASALLDSNWSGVNYAAFALGHIDDLRAVEPLIAALKSSNYDVRRSAAFALGNIGDPRAIEPLIAALKDSKDIVRINAVEALDKLKWTPHNDELSAYYRIAKNERDKYIKLYG